MGAVYTTLVSIPLWFSRNQVKERKRRISTSFHTTMVLTQRASTHYKREVCPAFPYHYGSHATLSWVTYGLPEKSFHTTMVLTQRSCKTYSRQFHVSIPLWFSRNLRQQPLSPSQLSVSIPLWFSRNVKTVYGDVTGVPFPYHYGSHATWPAGCPRGRT